MTKIASLVVASVLGLAACGSDDGDVDEGFPTEPAGAVDGRRLNSYYVLADATAAAARFLNARA